MLDLISWCISVAERTFVVCHICSRAYDWIRTNYLVFTKDVLIHMSFTSWLGELHMISMDLGWTLHLPTFDYRVCFSELVDLKTWRSIADLDCDNLTAGGFSKPLRYHYANAP